MEARVYGSPAEESALKVLQGIWIIQGHHPKVRLIGLNKGIFVGPCDDPGSDPSYTIAQLKQLEELGWSWSREQEAWEFYTGHG